MVDNGANIGFPGGGNGPGDTGGEAMSEAPAEDPNLVLDEAAWRKRALAAEERARELEGELDRVRGEAADAQALAARAETGRELDLALLEAGVLDLDAARLLADSGSLEVEGEGPVAAVDALRRERPWLFAAGGFASAAMAGELDGGPSALDEMRETARCSGDRRHLLRYLRGKRGQG